MFFWRNGLKIVIPDWKTVTGGDIDLSIFERFGEVTAYSLTPDDKLAERIADADIVLCNKAIMNENTLRLAGHLKYIGLFAVGYNNIDTEYTDSRGITVCNAGTYSEDAVAQHTFALILDHFNNVSKYNEFVQAGGWVNSDRFSPFVYPLNELAGKTIGIVGCGSIGGRVAKIADAFGMKVLACGRSPHPDEGGIVTWCDFESLLAASDIVTVHCPLNADSYRMFDKAAFAKMKKGAYFINTARGAIMDEDALAEAVESGHLGGAGIDVLEDEPMKSGCVLLNVEGITITPHVAWAPIETRLRLMDIVTDNIQNFLDGHPTHVVGSKKFYRGQALGKG